MPYKFPKTLLINVPDYNDNRAGEPLGLAYLKAFLGKNGFLCDILDANPAGSKKASRSELARLAAKKRYGIVGMTVFTHLFYKTINLARDIKQLSPKTKIVLGGHHVTFTHKDVLKRYPFIDFIVRGEGELTLLDLVRCIKEKRDFKNVKGITYRSKNGITVNPPRPLIKDIDTLPHPYRDRNRLKNQPENWKAASLITSRGCPFRCSFCSISAFYRSQPGRSYRMRSPAGIASEIEALVKKFGVKQVAFKDDNMFVDAKRLINLTDLLISRGIFLKYNIIARPDDVVKNEKYIPLLKKRGFESAEVGFEAGSERALKRFSKDLDCATNRKAIAILRKNNIDTLVDYIMFDPDMTLRDFRENIDFIKELGPAPFTHRSFIFGCLLQGVDLHPGTSYYGKMLKEGRLKKGIFAPKWDFKDESMQKAHKFIRKYTKTLRKKIRPLKRLRLEKLVELNLSKRPTVEKTLKRGQLKHLDYELDRVYLELLEKTLVIGKRFNFSEKGFRRVRKAITARLKTLKSRIQ